MTTPEHARPIRQLVAVASAVLLAALTLVVPHSAGAAETWSTSVTVTDATEAGGLTFTVSGTGFTGLPNASTGAPAAGVYIALRDPATQTDAAINADNSVSPKFTFLPGATFPTGAFTTTLTAPTAKLDPDADYEVIVWSAHGNITPETLLTTTPVPLTNAQKQALFPGWTPPTTTPPTTTPPVTAPPTTGAPATTTPPGSGHTWQTTATVADATAATGLTLDVEGTGFTALPDSSTGGPAQGVYVVLRDPATMTDDAINADNSIVPVVSFIPKAMIDSGGFHTTLSVPASSLDPDAAYEVIVWVAHGNITDTTLLTTTPITLTDAQRQALFGGAVPPTTAPTTTLPGNTPTTTRPSTPGTHQNTGTNAAGLYCVYETTDGTSGTPQLNWGVKSSFSNYIEGNIAKGSIDTGNGATRTGDTFTWPNGSGSVNDAGQGTWSFVGYVHFTGHDNALNTTFSNPRVQADGGGRGVLIADVVSNDIDGNNVGGASMQVANLQFSTISPSGARASATLTAQGARALNSMYEPGDAMDPLTVTVSGGSAGTTVENCYDAQGNLVSSTPVDGSNGTSGQLATTGSNTGPLLAFGGILILLGGVALLLVTVRRRSDIPAA